MAISQNFPSVRPSLDLNFAGTKKLDSRITFTRGSVGTYYDVNGVLQTAAPHVARFDHDPVTGESLGLLVEQSGTNLVGYSVDFSSGWNKSGISRFIPNSIIAPDGTLTGSFVAWQNSTAPLTSGLGLQSTVNGARGATNTLSCYAKIGTARYLALAITNNSGLTATGIFDLQTGTVNGSGSHPSYTVNATSISNVGSGWYRCSLTVTGGSDIHISSSTSGAGGVYNRDVSGDGSSGIYVWGAQLEAGNFPTTYIPTPATFTGRSSTATFYDSSGIIRTAASGVARSAAFFPDSNGVMRSAGLLLEAAGTNLSLYSEQFDNAYWNKSVGGNTATISANSDTSPDNTSTADKIVTSTNNAVHGVQRVGISIVNGTTYTCSVYAKSAGWSRIGIRSGHNSADFYCTVNLNTGAIVNALGNVSIQVLPNGWYRISVTGTATGTNGEITLEAHNTTTVQQNELGDGSSGILIWGAQLEASSYSTSYIPTTTATVTRAADTSTSSTVTRNADSAFMTGTNFTSWYNYSQGALYIESQNDYNASIFSHAGTGVEIHSNAFQSNMLSFNSKRDSLSYSSPWFNIFSRGDGIGAIGNGRIGGGSNRISGSVFYKSSFSWSFINSVGVASTVTTVATSADGTTTSSATSATVTSPPVTTLGFAANNYAYDPFSGRIKRLTYWPETIPNSVVQQITR